MLRTLVCAGHDFHEERDPQRISELLEDPHQHIWLDIEAPTEDEFRMIAEEFNLHPLALEDAHLQHQRPKVEQYDGFYFVIFYSVDIRGEDGEPLPLTARPALHGTNVGKHESANPHHGPGNERAPLELTHRVERRPSKLRRNHNRNADEEPQSTERVFLHELAMFMGSNYLITVHADPIPELAEAERRWRANTALMKKPKKSGKSGSGTDQTGPLNGANGSNEAAPLAAAVEGVPVAAATDAAVAATGSSNGSAGGKKPKVDDIGILLYSLLDSIVDDYFPVIDNIVDRVENLEEQVFERFSDKAMQSIFALKKDLLALRKVLAPERDVLNVLTRRDLPLFTSSTILYFQDVYDHVVRITDSIDTYRDLLSSALDSFLSVQSNRLNVTVQTLTSASIILMTLALIAGIYGMNFDNMPELHWPFGYAYAVGLMFLVTVGLFFFFKRKHWL